MAAMIVSGRRQGAREQAQALVQRPVLFRRQFLVLLARPGRPGYTRFHHLQVGGAVTVVQAALNPTR